MRLFALAVFVTVSGAAAAQTQDCRAIADPTAQLACYNNEPMPLAAPRRSRSPSPSPAPPAKRADVDRSGDTTDIDDSVMRARINGICRGC